MSNALRMGQSTSEGVSSYTIGNTRAPMALCSLEDSREKAV